MLTQKETQVYNDKMFHDKGKEEYPTKISTQFEYTSQLGKPLFFDIIQMDMEGWRLYFL